MNTGRAIIVAAIILSVVLAILFTLNQYFSPYETCKREMRALLEDPALIEGVPSEAKIRVSNEVCIGQ